MVTSRCDTCGSTESSRWYRNNTQCASCNKKEWYSKNRDKALQKSKEWQANNKDLKSKLNKRWYSENRQHRLLKNKEFTRSNPDYAKQWRDDNRGKLNSYLANRRCIKRDATIDNFKDDIESIYEEAAYLQKQDGVPREVHHIVPLQELRDTVCGLHVPWNLEILTKDEHLEAHEILRKVFKYENRSED